MKGTLSELVTQMLSRPVVANAIKVSLFVGTCLNAINQGSAIWHGTGIDLSKVALNYAVPFLVSSYSAAKARLAEEN